MKSFNLEIPFTQSSTDDEGNYLIAFSISTTVKDAYGFTMSEKALDSMLAQVRGLTINANHKHDLGNVIGPVVDAWLEKKDDITYLWIQARVRNEWVSTIKDLIDSGVQLGGSIECDFVDVSYTESGDLVVEDLILNGAALTTIPANTATLGTATNVMDGCPGSLCVQLQKSLENMGVDFLPKKENTKKEGENFDENKGKESDSNWDYKTFFTKRMESLSDKVENILNKLDDAKTETKEDKVETTVSPKTEAMQMEKEVDLELNKLKEKYSSLEKEVISLKAENKSLNNIIGGMKEDKLVKKALELNKSLDPNTSILDEAALRKELETLHQGNGDFMMSLESYNNGLEMALSKMPQGDLPKIDSNTFSRNESNLRAKLLKKDSRINGMGREE